MKILIELMRKIALPLVMGSVLIVTVAATGFLKSVVVEWDKTNSRPGSNGSVREIIRGSTRSLEGFEIIACSLDPGSATKSFRVEKGSDNMIIIKEGTGNLQIDGNSTIMGQGSVAVIPQGSGIRLNNNGDSGMEYFIFRFITKVSKTGFVSSQKTGAYISLWDTVTFKPSANGGRRNIINEPTSSLKNLEIHVTTLKEGLPSHSAHTHTDDEIILIRRGTVKETINGMPYTAGPGSVIFLTGDDDHGIANVGKGECEYYAIRWITERTPLSK